MNRYEDAFLWLKEAQITYPCHGIREIQSPLAQSAKKNIFKLFLNDVGTLVSNLPPETRRRILLDSSDIPFNRKSLYENFVMQQLVANSLAPYFGSSRKLAKLDFLVEVDDQIDAIAVPSKPHGKRNIALENLFYQKEYKIGKYIVLSRNNLRKENGILYLPIYLCGLIKNTAF